MKTVEEILYSMGIMNPVRCGDLKYVNLECKDLAKNPIKKACGFLRRIFPDFIIDYTPKIEADALLIPEDVSPGMRRMASNAIKQGIKVFVVQHGALQNPSGFVPLYGDYFLCWEECVDKCIRWGMDADRVIPFKPEPPKHLKKIEGIDSVLFLLPPAKGRHHHSIVQHFDEYEILQKIVALQDKEPHLVIKPHPKLWEYMEPLLIFHEVVWHNAYDLIYSAKRIYSMKGCTTIKDCEVLGKKAIVI